MGRDELGCTDACHRNVTSRQTPARCQRYLWSRHRQRKCRTIRSSRPNSAGHFVTDDRAHGGFVVFGSFTFCMGVIGPGNRSRARKGHGPTGRHWIGLNGAVVFNRRSARRGPILPFRGLEVHGYPHGLAPRSRKGRWDTVPSLVCALMTEVNCGGYGLRNSALVASPGFSPFGAGALLHCAGLCRRTGRTSRSGPAQFLAGEFAVGILVQALQDHTGVVDFGGIDDPVVVGIQRGDHEWSGRLGTLGGPCLAAGGRRFV